MKKLLIFTVAIVNSFALLGCTNLPTEEDVEVMGNKEVAEEKEDQSDVYCYEKKGFDPVEATFTQSSKDGIFYSYAVMPDYHDEFSEISMPLIEKINDYLNEKYEIPFCNQSNNYMKVSLGITKGKTPGEVDKELMDFISKNLEGILEEYKQKAEEENFVEFKTPGAYTMLEYSGVDAGCLSKIVTDKYVISLNSFPSNCNTSEIYGYG